MKLLQAISDALWPRYCPVCGKVLAAAQRQGQVCPSCMAGLPVTLFWQHKFNAMEQLFAGKTPIARAAALFFYERSSPYAAILHDAKYRHRPQLGQWMARQAAAAMQASGMWQGIDYIVPVPLHPAKLLRRGYNQTDYIARGLSQETGIAVLQALVARRGHSTQTHKGRVERYFNTRGLYGPAPGVAAMLQGKHVLIADDVCTTGATLEACAASLQHIPGITISLFALAAAKNS